MKTLKNFNIFSILPKNDKVQVSITPITIKFNCKSCNQINKAVIGHTKTRKDVDFDLSNIYDYAGVTWRLDCSFCNARNDIEFLVKHLNIEN